jgi:Raf kinase inhibitor-like YbhB/YbcL family protein
MQRTIGVLSACLLVLGGCGRAKQESAPRAAPETKVPGATLTVTSSAFGPGGTIPIRYTGDGEDLSPPLSWTGAPEGTVEFALVCDDPDAPIVDAWVHWVLFGIPGTTTSLAEGSRGVGIEGDTSWRRPGYGGPQPPRGHGAHHYYFRVWALDARLGLDPGATKKDLLQAIEGHVLARGELVGTYER